MVTKVGSAGQVIESVIQYQQFNPASKADAAPDEKAAKEAKRSLAHFSMAPDRMRDSSEIRNEIRSRNAVNSNKTPAPPPAPVTGAVEMENADGEIIEANGLDLSEEAVKITVEDVNKRLAPQGATVEFSYHEKTGRYSFKVLEIETGKVIREVPPQKSLDMVAKMFELAGLIIDERR